MRPPILLAAALGIACSASLLAGCGRTDRPGGAPSDTTAVAPAARDSLAAEASLPVEERARRIAARHLVIDGHVDAMYRLASEPWADLVGEADPAGDTLGDFSFRRARLGGLDAPFLSIYVPAETQGRPGAAAAHANATLDRLDALVAAHPDRFAIARSPADVERIAASGRVALPLGMENGAPLASVEDVQHFYRRGIRYVTLAHSRHNALADASYDRGARHGGLSPLGRTVVAEMNRLGMMVDVSHVTDAAAFDALAASRAPVIASHSGLRALTPGWPRNVPDTLARAIAARGGLVMVNFGSSFLRPAFRDGERAVQARYRRLLAARGLGRRDRAAAPLFYALRRTDALGTVADVADHVDHAVKVMGIDHVGIGSDFDGVTSLPRGLTDVSMYPNLVAELLQRGYDEPAIAKILGGNLLRVWRAVEAAADAPALAATAKPAVS